MYRAKPPLALDNMLHICYKKNRRGIMNRLPLINDLFLNSPYKYASVLPAPGKTPVDGRDVNILLEMSLI